MPKRKQARKKKPKKGRNRDGTFKKGHKLSKGSRNRKDPKRKKKKKHVSKGNRKKSKSYLHAAPYLGTTTVHSHQQSGTSSHATHSTPSKEKRVTDIRIPFDDRDNLLEYAQNFRERHPQGAKVVGDFIRGIPRFISDEPGSLEEVLRGKRNVSRHDEL
jgi:hypothetical protein